MSDFLRALLYLTVVVNIILALIVIKSNSNKVENRFFAVFLFAAAFWAIGDALMLYSDNYDIAHTGVVLFYVAPLITTLFVLLFSFIFPNNRPIKLRTIIIFSIPTLIYFALMSIRPDLFLKSIDILPGGQNTITHHAKPYQIYALYFNVYFLICYGALIVSYRRSSGNTRKRVAYALWSIIVTSFLALFTNLTLPILGKGQYVFAGPMFLLIFAVIVTLGIIRHRLFDIRLIVARSLGYILSIGSLALIYGFVAFNVINQLFFGSSNISFWQRVVYTMLAGIIAFTFQPLKKFFDRWSNRIFYQDAYDTQELLNNLNNVLVRTIDLDKLLSDSAAIIANTFKTEFVLFGVKEVNNSPQRIIGTINEHFDKDDIAKVRSITPRLKLKTIIVDELPEDDTMLRPVLRRNNIAGIVRLTDTPAQNIEGIGYLILGNKKSGNQLSSQDIKVLEIIADEMVIAIQNSLRFEEIQSFNITLQAKVDEATRQLRKTNEKLKALDETKDEFISMASHQLRTPLTSMKGYVSMVLDEDVGRITAKQRQLLDQAFASSQRMVFLIADLLNVSRLRTGKFVIENKPTQLTDVISTELEQLDRVAKVKNLELSFEKPKNLPMLMLDETKIRQVIMNFIDNALYYTPAGGYVKIKLTDNAKSVEFKVVDNGLGVPKAEQHHLFTKFYRAGNARKARPDGTGLGLFMAKKVIIAQGGAIVFSSQEGKGSTFGFTLPKAKLAVVSK